MPTLSEIVSAPIAAILSSFEMLFSSRVWPKAQVLLLGAILCPGKRTVSAIDSQPLAQNLPPHFLQLWTELLCYAA